LSFIVLILTLFYAGYCCTLFYTGGLFPTNPVTFKLEQKYLVGDVGLIQKLFNHKLGWWRYPSSWWYHVFANFFFCSGVYYHFEL